MTNDEHNFPFASAEYLDDGSFLAEKRNVMQAHVPDQDDQGAFTEAVSNEPTIHVPARDVTVNDEAPKNKENANGDEVVDTKMSNNNNLHPSIATLKQKRKRNQKVAIVAGFVVGCILCGPVLGVIGAVGAHHTVKRLGRAKQARMQAELDRDYAMAMHVAAIQKE